MEGNVGPSGAEQLGHQALGQPDGLILVTRLIARPALLSREDEKLSRRVANQTTRESIG